MAIFISYSHADKEFVDRLSIQLVRERASIWLDRWELNVGDSLVQRVQQAIEGAGALLVVLSKTSVESEWCKKELTAGLVRELEGKKVIVLPVLLEVCTIPLFLRDKLCADFRNDYDEGLRHLLKGLARFINDTRGNIPGPDANVDWAVDWKLVDNGIHFTITMVQQVKDVPYTVLLQVEVEGNTVLRDRYVRYEERGLDWLYRQVIIELLRDAAVENDLRLLLRVPQPATRRIAFADKRTGMEARVAVVGRILGQDQGSDVLLDIAHDFSAVLMSMREHARPPSDTELATAKALAAEFAPS